MRWPYFIFFQFLLIAVVGTLVYLHKDKVVMLKTPPASLAQWYKPENKRQVWLHNMFKLRRELQAVRLYANNQDAGHLQQWAADLSEHYLKIGEMVPEWERKLDKKLIDGLLQSASNMRYQEVIEALDELNNNCDSCHADYRVVTQLVYRAADFSSVKVPGSSISFKDGMKDLTAKINLIKIASDDGQPGVALAAMTSLQKEVSALGETCVNCHEKNKKEFPDSAINATFGKLKQSLLTGTAKEQGQELGTLAVLACAQCHGTHRMAYEARNLFVEKRSWRELMKH